jgi:hypothetical protein
MFLRICFGLQNEYFFRYMDDRNAAEIFRANGDINGLKSHCNSQVNPQPVFNMSAVNISFLVCLASVD